MKILNKEITIYFTVKHPRSRKPIELWAARITLSRATSLHKLRQDITDADVVSGVTVFNLGGNKYRLGAVVSYQKQVVSVQWIKTHREYDKWKR